ncbi:TPA: hypothetical protein ACS78B_003725 [Providencia alcalifaciens]|uniref:hypothetical protein n=1 Tax=Providencia alcalifaciens TaxID=126385 RepID=UPI001CC39DAC|nr:hypothetical protein [Providencia alcalifaciens]CAG9418387.1 hypothetical protein NVI2019_NGLDDFDA_01618 [Providencia alcalifaciens]
MEFKGSKAPWHIGSHPFEYKNRHTVRCDNNSVIAHILQPGDTESAAIAQADTRLIAAAPELLESLRELVSAMERYEIDVDERAPVKHKEMMNKANSAIAKALGQQ